MANAEKWYGTKFPDSELVGLIVRFARPTADGQVAIDVGCGAGRHIKLLADLGYSALGLDTDPKMIEMATKNGLDARQADIATFQPTDRPDLVVGWGLVMLAGQATQIIASWRPRVVILDWRTENNTFLTWPDNERQPDGSILLRRPGHTLDGQRYFVHTLAECQVPGYERIHWQRLAKTTADEANEWYQTVHREATSSA